MKRFWLIFGILILFFQSTFAQYYGKLIIYTDEPNASFIPYIDGEKQTLAPVDTFVTELPNVDYVIVNVDFADSTVYDLEFKVGFKNFKTRIIHIVTVGKDNMWKKLMFGFQEKHIPPDNGKEVYDRYTIKDESVREYLKNTNFD